MEGDRVSTEDYEQPGHWPGGGHSGFAPDGYAWPGRGGTARHVGPPLTPDQTAQLPDGAEIVITWFGGNGPHPYRVLVTHWGQRRIEGLYCDPLPNFGGDRITLGWDEETRAYHDRKSPMPDHITDRWAALRDGAR